MAYKNPKEMAESFTKEFVPFKLDKEKYPDVEETPYGFIYNVGNKSITDTTSQMKRMMPSHFKEGVDYGFTVTTDSGDEVFYPTWEDAYAYAKGIKK